LVIIDFIGFIIVDEGGFNLLEEGITFDGCFKRELFVIVVVVVVVVIRFGNCETVLLFLLRLPFGVDGVFVALDGFVRLVLVLLLRRTVAAEDVVLLDDDDDDELVIKRRDGGECV
jgi:hypothetical protein